MPGGLIHIYTGDGKGKTTAALGLAFRAIGYGKTVKLVRFLKGGFSGELETGKHLKEWLIIDQINPFPRQIFSLTDDEQRELAELTHAKVGELTSSLREGEFDLYIFDEIFGSLKRKQIGIDQIKEMLLAKAPGVEVVLTGRDAPLALRELADYVTVMQKEAHPFDKSIPARQGIEY